MDKSVDFLHGNSLNQSSCDSEPNMTILTHGLGGDGLAWSKGYKTNNDPVYIYSPNNLIEQLKDNAKNAEILLCKNFDSGANINFNVYKMTLVGVFFNWLDSEDRVNLQQNTLGTIFFGILP